LLSFDHARSTLASALVFVSLTVAGTASANPRIFPFTYTVDTLPKGELEIEQYVDYIPIRVLSNATGRPAWYGSTDFQTELEYGITSKLELGLYLTFAPSEGQDYSSFAAPIEGNGLKERLKYRFAEPGEWPIDLGVYGELVEDQREIELEAKIILERRLGPMRIAANLTGEREYYFNSQKDWVLNPSLGASVEATPAIQPGIEAFLRSEYTSPKITPRPFDLGPHVYVGPTLLSQFGRLWWAVGAYARVTDHSHTLAAGEAYGNYWVRSVFGYEL
jgi:hypothetical protein